ncbi:hypothetical protein DNTS_000282 [Danionella cerebrum]|uniref:phosphatidylinositol-3,4,5-trisphosphate 5-phosphatase n=1 Tax=Danionella cerebrum TaxID=2873325 RepID=A0A553R6Y6_9TELE|nr:hypothetical protein DNTS_000282 [Danionella translucida]
MVELVLFTSWMETELENLFKASLENSSSSFVVFGTTHLKGHFLETAMTAAWYHRDISRVRAEELLAHAGKDGSFLVRDSESVPGAYALCLLFQRHVHTYRILPNADGLLAVQATQGIQVNCFQTLGDLVLGYQYPNKGLVAALMYPVNREMEFNEESSDGDDEKPCSTATSPPYALSPTGYPAAPSSTALNLLLQSRQELSSNSVGYEINSLLEEYLHGNVCKDLENVKGGASGLQHFQGFLNNMCESLHIEIDQTLSSLETLAKVFDHPSGHLLFTSLQVLDALQDAVSNHKLSVQPTPPPESSRAPKMVSRPNSVHSFQVKVVRYGRQTVSVDIDAGLVLFDKKSGSFVVQLVKFHKGPAKLKMVVDSHHNPPRELVFESSKEALPRPAHCSLGGLGLNQDESISAIPHDIYAVGTQDNPQAEKEWAEHIRATLRHTTNTDFKQVAVQSLWNIRLAVFVKPELEASITQINTASVKTGLGNTLGNKGAVGVSFVFNGTSMGFVNCHLTSGGDKALRRNHNFQDILRLLSLGEKQLGAFDISLRFNHLFWCGDLNYRLDLDALDILKHVSKREFEELMCADQLTRERHRRKAFFNFKEEKIMFPPTYRYERGSRDCYLWQKYKSSGVQVNGPSWCDRVLWKSYPESYINCTSYGCTDDIFTSEHSPVFATFEVGVVSQFPKADLAQERASIELEVIEAIVKTSSKAKFFIEFHSRCLEGILFAFIKSLAPFIKLLLLFCFTFHIEPQRSAENDSQSSEVPGFLKLGWSSKQFPKLQPVFSDLEHLRDQHLLLSVKSCDGFESYGESCVALCSITGKLLDSFETCLTHRGEEMGSIRGRIRVYVPPHHRRTRERVYAPSTSYSSAPNCYTNPAYFIFEGVPILRKIEKIPPIIKESHLVCSDDTVIQLPRVTGSHSHGRTSARRSDFTEIEIPGTLAPYKSSCETQSELPTVSPYQLFPSPNISNTPLNPRCTSSSKTPLQREPQNITTTKESAKTIKNSYMNHYVFYRHLQSENIKQSCPGTEPHPIPMRNGEKLYPYMSTRVPIHQACVPWIVEQPNTALGDNSLTALQMAKSLSEVDFQPAQRKYHIQPSPSQQRLPGYNYGLVCEKNNHSWEKERYTMELSRNGWDDLDYFSGITEEELRAAGVSNPIHRRRILENLPKIWD